MNRVLRFRSENWTSAGSMLDIGTRSIFNEDHDMFRESVRRFFKERIEPFQNEWDDVGHVPRELWTEAGEMGLLGVNTSDVIGGIGGNFLRYGCSRRTTIHCKQFNRMVSPFWYVSILFMNYKYGLLKS